MTTRGSSRALFLDRDGTIIHDVGYPRDPATVEALPAVADALREARELGYRLVIVSNQSGVGRGLIQRSEARDVQARVEEMFAAEGVTFDAAYFCFHRPEDACGCRKPAPGMLLHAKAELDLDLGRSIMIGDKPSDVEAGRAAGCKAVAFGEIRHPGAEAALSSWPALVDWLRARADEGPRKG